MDRVITNSAHTDFVWDQFACDIAQVIVCEVDWRQMRLLRRECDRAFQDLASGCLQARGKKTIARLEYLPFTALIVHVAFIVKSARFDIVRYDQKGNRVSRSGEYLTELGYMYQIANWMASSVLAPVSLCQSDFYNVKSHSCIKQ